MGKDLAVQRIMTEGRVEFCKTRATLGRVVSCSKCGSRYYLLQATFREWCCMGQNGESMNASLIINTIVRGARIARRLGGQRFLARARDRASIGVLDLLHSEVVHRMRRLAIQMSDWNKDQDAAAQLAMDVCTSCRELLARHLELKKHELHCHLKVMAQKSKPDEPDRVATWVRSFPFDDRPVEMGDQNAHLVSANTVWCALLGQSDDITCWRPFSCFACNDLTKHPSLFKCDRQAWSRYYQSTLVFPLRYVQNVHGAGFENIGFLAFDSPKPGVFLKVPDIFDYRDKPNVYQDLLDDTTAFHLGAIMADTLSTFLRRCYQDTRSPNGGLL